MSQNPPLFYKLFQTKRSFFSKWFKWFITHSKIFGWAIKNTFFSIYVVCNVGEDKIFSGKILFTDYRIMEYITTTNSESLKVIQDLWSVIVSCQLFM